MDDLLNPNSEAYQKRRAELLARTLEQATAAGVPWTTVLAYHCLLGNPVYTVATPPHRVSEQPRLDHNDE